jgi:hypothetical protein
VDPEQVGIPVVLGYRRVDERDRLLAEQVSSLPVQRTTTGREPNLAIGLVAAG